MLSEDFGNDVENRKKARQAQTLFYRWITRANEDEDLDAVEGIEYFNIEGDDFYGVKASCLNLPYDDLYIGFMLRKQKGDQPYGSLITMLEQGRPKFFLALTYNGQPTDRDVIFSTSSHVFIHEMVHYLDRSSGKFDYQAERDRVLKQIQDKTPEKQKTPQQYYNDPLEFNAHYQQTIYLLIEEMKNSQNAFDEYLKSFSVFVKQFKLNAPKFFWKYLDEKYSVKLKKRLYMAYQGFARCWPNVEEMKSL